MDKKTAILSLAFLVMLMVPQAPATHGDRTSLLDDAQEHAAGGNTPAGTWERTIEDVTMYFHSETPQAREPGDPPANFDTGYYDYEAPENNDRQKSVVTRTSQAGPDTRVSFHLPTGKTGVDWPKYPSSLGGNAIDLRATTPFDVYQIDVRAYARCTQVQDIQNLLRVDIDVMNPDGTKNRDVANQAMTTGSARADNVRSFTYSHSVGQIGAENGIQIDPGQYLRFQFYPDPFNLGLIFTTVQRNIIDCEVFYDSTSNPTQATLKADSGRGNTWITDRFGQVVASLPDASSTAAANRKFQLHVVQASAWPNLGDYRDWRTFTDADACDTIGDDANSEDYLGAVYNAYRFNLRNQDTGALVYQEAQGADNSVLKRESKSCASLGPDVNKWTYQYQYTTALAKANYRPEIASNGLTVLGKEIAVGVKGFEVNLVEAKNHEINPGQRTEFVYHVTNSGGSEDTISAKHIGLASGWKGDFSPGKVRLLPNAQAELVLSVTPPSGAVAGASTDVKVEFTSSFPNEVPAKTLTHKATIVSATTPGGKLTSTTSLVEIFPGESISIPGVRLFNDAPFADSFILSAKFPSGTVGWTGTVSPSGATIPADSLRDFSVTIKAPTSAVDGSQTAVTISATRVGATTPLASVNIPIEVVYNPAVVVAPADYYPEDQFYDASGIPGVYQEIRNSGARSCPASYTPFICTRQATAISDDVHEDDAIFRVEITNPTPVQDTYELTARWNTAGSVKGIAVRDGGQDGDGSGWPDWWRLNFGTESDVTDNSDAAARTSNLRDTVTVPPFTTVYRYVEMGWVPCSGSGCSVPGSGAVQVTARSQNDRAVTDTFEFGVYRASAGGVEAEPREFEGSRQNVAIQAERTDGKLRLQPVDATVARAPDGSYAEVRHTFRITNLGNEYEHLTIDVPKAPAGWTRALQFDGNTAKNVVPTTNGACSASGSSGLKFICPSMGAGDEAVLQLVTKPNNGLALGQVLTSVVTVRAEGDPSVLERETFTTKTIGTFDFDAQELKKVRSASAGSTVSLPFVVKNTGSSGDNFDVVLTQGNADWRPRFSSDQRFFIPGQGQQDGFLLVTIPSNAPVTPAGQTGQVFRVQVENDAETAIEILDFEVRVVAGTGIVIKALDGTVEKDSVILENRGAANNVEIQARGGTSGKAATFSIDTDSLPDGWTASLTTTSATFGTDQKAKVTATVTPPVDALTTSKVPLLVTVASDGKSTTGDIVLGLVDDAAVQVNITSEHPQSILPGGQVTYTALVQNNGLSQDTFDFTTTSLPTGWSVAFSPASLPLGPREAGSVDIILNAPANAPAKENVTFNLFVTSQLDATIFQAVPVSTLVGFNDFQATFPTDTIYLAPAETGRFTATIKNTGSLADEVRLTAKVDSAALAKLGTATVSPSVLELGLDQAKQTTVTFNLGENAPSDIELVVNLTIESLKDVSANPAKESVDLKVRVLSHVKQDVDGDGILEFAVSRDRASGNGFEEFREGPSKGGHQGQSAGLEDLLSDQGRASKVRTVTLADGNTTQQFIYIIDGDEDGKVDHFIDTTQDGRPNIYWDPDRSQVGGKTHAMNLTIIKDINGDGVLDYFVDVDGDKTIDRVFDVRMGKFIKVLVRDIDGDGTLDYAVDANGNGMIDPQETVLFTRGGVLLTVLKVDVDGDGQLDDVFDTDGDGRVDSFIRAGESQARKITLKDVTGDGILDWTYDSNGDGRADSYYDPATGTGGHKIDNASTFGNLVADFWYVPALFVLVVVLFVVLIAVTRR